ncbi:hypothetical protein [Xenorhabdus hominickii]|uniref:Uncharacterized protein n=1 Tax=Xenorhabdus hominickii TaxID=351679 RepID=A0A2G0Q2K0_XENHO|nr:hypothetical protein [Xenorhabdus hominickii]AOM39676.1 hypothetical protein A9255_03170 [Xenorhabdus hominickii]PHM53435.1 hypothetical protein Xhom_03433 [Xenorhabdus hominickii]
MEEMMKTIASLFDAYIVLFSLFWCVTIPIGVGLIAPACIFKTKFSRVFFPISAMFFLFPSIFVLLSIVLSK